MPIRCTEWQEPVSLLRDERLLKRTGPTSLRTQTRRVTVECRATR
jgi:hypothetical protein